jgi:hypothetical protein
MRIRELEGDQLVWANLTVSIAAVFYSEYKDGVAQFVEADAVITGTETELRRFDFLEALDVPLARGQIAGKNMQDAKRCGLINGAKLGFGRIGPDDFLGHVYLPDS